MFFSGAAAPAVLVAGSRRSARVSHPSKRLVNPDNAERASSSKRPRTRKILVYDSEVEGDGDVVEDMEDVEELAVGSDDATGDTDVDLDDEAEEAYASTKAMGDADRKALSKQTKTDRTADIRTIFKHDREHINPDTGNLEDGHLCTICQTAGVLRKNCFFLGSITTLRTHISRNPGHIKVYTERCQKLGIAINPRVLAKTESSVSIERQGTLDNSISRTPRLPAFTTDGLLDYIVELVVSQDEAFQLVDKEQFRRLLTYL